MAFRDCTRITPNKIIAAERITLKETCSPKIIAPRRIATAGLT